MTANLTNIIICATVPIGIAMALSSNLAALIARLF